MNEPRTNKARESSCFRAGALALGLAAVFSLSFLSGVFSGSGKEKPGRLANASSSIREIADNVLSLLAKNDFESLEKMRMTEEEFKTIIWPELPRAVTEPSCGKFCDWCWRDLNHKSVLSLRMTLQRYGGEKLRDHEFLRLRFAGETTEYETFKVHRNVYVVMRDKTGEEKNIKLFGTVIEMDNHFKLMGFLAKY